MRQVDISSTLTDALSELGYDLLRINQPAAYTRLVVRGNGTPEALQALRGVAPEQLVAKPLASPDDARAMLAGLWLWHDWLDESHVISQSLHSATGSFWHAIMHRREGDFSNSKYWYARCAQHPVLTSMGPFAGDLLNHLPADKSLLRLIRSGWDPDAFVDLSEELHERPTDARHAVAVRLQQLEWRLLFEHCTRLASGQ